MSPQWRVIAWLPRQLLHCVLAGLVCLLGACGEQPAADFPVAPNTPTLFSSTTVTQAQEFTVTSMDKVGEKRVAGTVFEYSFRVSIKNVGPSDAVGVSAVITETGPGTDMVIGGVTVASLKAGETASSPDLIVLRHDSALPFAPKRIAWDILDEASLRLNELQPAKTYVFSFRELSIAAGADSVAVSGAIGEALIRQGTLRFSTPGDTGADQYASLVIHAGAAVKVIRVRIRSLLSSRIVEMREGADGAATPAASLVLSGVGASNRLTGDPLRFTLSGFPAIKLAKNCGAMILLPNGTAIGLEEYWRFDQQSQSFSISGDALATLLQKLPPGPLGVVAAFLSDDSEVGVNFDFTVIKATAKLTGSFVLPDGSGAGVLGGKKVLLEGVYGKMRMDTTITANGKFAFEGVIPDTYYITLSDLEHPDEVHELATVLPESTEVNVTVVYATGQENKAPVGVSNSMKGASKQNSIPAPMRRSRQGSAVRAMQAMPSSPKAGHTAKVFSASAGEENVLSSIPIDVVVPKSTPTVNVTTTVTSEEFPIFTKQQSIHDDTWSYQVAGLGKPIREVGSVNRSHVARPTVSKSECVDVRAQTLHGPLSITGYVKATNIGDAELSTVTSVEIGYPCLELSIVSATFLSRNPDGYTVLQPIHTGDGGNLTGPYLSVAESSSSAVRTVPLEVKFYPADAQIREMNISVWQGDELHFTSGNLMSQSNTITNGTIRFPRLKLPISWLPQASGKVNVVLRIKGKIDGKDIASDPQKNGAVGLNNAPTSFTPLYLAGAEPELSGRRFGQPEDAGGDSWATRQSIQWAKTKPYRFNDISGLHVAQSSGGGSLLGHKGHSDGQQFDLRYADAQGGFSELLGGAQEGAGIRQLIMAAKAEVSANAILKPNLLRLQAWISANRAMMDAEAAMSGTRVIYVGQGFIGNALIDGTFTPAANDTIPGVLRWQHSQKIRTSPGHMSHWHLSITQHP